jgi:hypothetical protein
MKPEDFAALLAAGIVGREPIEYIGGKWVMGDYEFHFTPAMAADAAKLGIVVPTCAGAGSVAAARAITSDQYRRLYEHGVIGQIELIEGVITNGPRFPLAFSPEQTAAAREAGVDLAGPPSPDALL